jgi:threonine dehydrogenase-like Zn-dependent dehydrogenase
VRVPFADVGPLKVPDGPADERLLFLSDAFPTGYMGADLCDIKPGDAVAVWGCGAVGQFAIKGAFLLGAGRAFAIDRYPSRLETARRVSGAETLNYEEVDVVEAPRDLTAGRGPAACVDAVGLEAHGLGPAHAYDVVKQAARLETDRPHVLREAVRACRKGGTLAVMGVYGGFVDKFPMGAAFNKGLTLRMGQMHAHKYLPRLLERVMNGEVDPSFAATHLMGLDEAQGAFQLFNKKNDECMSVVFKP